MQIIAYGNCQTAFEFLRTWRLNPSLPDPYKVWGMGLSYERNLKIRQACEWCHQWSHLCKCQQEQGQLNNLVQCGLWLQGCSPHICCPSWHDSKRCLLCYWQDSDWFVEKMELASSGTFSVLTRYKTVWLWALSGGERIFMWHVLQDKRWDFECGIVCDNWYITKGCCTSTQTSTIVAGEYN
jgi:hypothetical protein